MLGAFTMKSRANVKRCRWVNPADPVSVAYHDEEWGVPVFDDVKLFEMLVLEGAQAGLSWATVLKRREAYREAFAQFDPVKVAQFTKKDVEHLMENEGLIRHRLKIESAIQNAKVFLEIQEKYGSFADFLWAYVNYEPIYHDIEVLELMPTQSDISVTLSRDLKKLGMSFVGPTIMYAYMQAVGMVNDHEVDCCKSSRNKG